MIRSIKISVVLLLTLGLLWENFRTPNNHVAIDFDSHLIDGYADNTLETLLINCPFEKEQTVLFDSIPPLLKQSQIQYFVFQNQRPLFWNSDKIYVTSLLNDTVAKGFVSLADGLFRVHKRVEGEFDFILLYPLIKNNSIDQAIQSHQSIVSGEIQVGKLKGNKVTYQAFNPSTATFIAPDLQEFDIQLQQQSFSYYSLFYFAASLLLCYLLFLLLGKSSVLIFHKHSMHWLFLLCLFLGLRILMFKGWFLQDFMDTAFFSPELFAYHNLVSSLGELYVNLAILFFVLQWFFSLSGHASLTAVPLWLRALLIHLLLVVFLSWLYVDIQHLVFDSNINFDPLRIENIDVYSLLGLMAITFYFVLFFVFLALLKRLFGGNVSLSAAKVRILIAIVIQLVFWGLLFVFNVFPNCKLYAIFALAFAAVVSFWYVIHPQTAIRNIYPKVSLILVFCFLVSVFLHQFITQKEQEFRRLFAYKMLYERDLEAEMKLLDLEQELEEKEVFESCFYDPENYAAQELVEVLKYDYLLGLMAEFDVDVYTFDGVSALWDANYKDDYNRFYTMFVESSGDNLSKKFLKINEGQTFSGYIAAHIIGEFDRADFRAVFIVLKQKFRGTNRVYTSFSGSKIGALGQNPYDYVYAIYSNNRLMRVSPEFPFERYNNQFRPGQREKFLPIDNHDFYMFNPEKGKLIVVAIEKRSWNSKLTVFSALLLFMVISWFLLIVLRWLIRMLSLNFKQWIWVWKGVYPRKFRLILPTINAMLLQSKIRTALFLELIISFVVGTVLVVNFISSNYRNAQQRLVLEKVKSISGELEKSGFLDLRNITGPRKEFLINLSESYQVDINLFGIDGSLIASSNLPLQHSQLLNDLMHPMAFKKLVIDKQFSYYQQEQLLDLAYRSYYQSVFNSRQELAGFIHLPYFARQRETQRETASLLIDILNVFVLFFVVTGLLSVFLSKIITRPLAIIGNHLRKLKFDGANEEIAWHSHDELGQLVQTYNRVVAELEKSVAKLAETEREGAWREMAKQVAHEIKNPLTPMRLGVQHLQRSVQHSDPETQAKITKTTQLLIGQIDMMTKMAEEFSSFAKMPQAHPEQLLMHELLAEVALLFDRSFDLKVELDIREGLALKVFADKDQLKRVFVNLIKNAHQAKKENEQAIVRIKLYAEEQYVMVEVEDNGIGIGFELKDKIFSPNFSTKTSGMGLGLAISKKIIELAGGSIWFKSVVDKGTTFFIKLPVS